LVLYESFWCFFAVYFVFFVLGGGIIEEKIRSLALAKNKVSLHRYLILILFKKINFMFF